MLYQPLTTIELGPGKENDPVNIRAFRIKSFGVFRILPGARQKDMTKTPKRDKSRQNATGFAPVFTALRSDKLPLRNSECGLGVRGHVRAFNAPVQPSPIRRRNFSPAVRRESPDSFHAGGQAQRVGGR